MAFFHFLASPAPTHFGAIFPILRVLVENVMFWVHFQSEGPASQSSEDVFLVGVDLRNSKLLTKIALFCSANEICKNYFRGGFIFVGLICSDVNLKLA